MHAENLVIAILGAVGEGLAGIIGSFASKEIEIRLKLILLYLHPSSHGRLLSTSASMENVWFAMGFHWRWYRVFGSLGL